jgi:hypothetical protein
MLYISFFILFIFYCRIHTFLSVATGYRRRALRDDYGRCAGRRCSRRRQAAVEASGGRRRVVFASAAIDGRRGRRGEGGFAMATESGVHVGGRWQWMRRRRGVEEDKGRGRQEGGGFAMAAESGVRVGGRWQWMRRRRGVEEDKGRGRRGERGDALMQHRRYSRERALPSSSLRGA